MSSAKPTGKGESTAGQGASDLKGTPASERDPAKPEGAPAGNGAISEGANPNGPVAEGPVPDLPLGDLEPGQAVDDEKLSVIQAKLKTIIIGKPRDFADQSIFRHVTLVAFLAWVGLGADGLSSSCYGPPEAFLHLGADHKYLAVFLALATVITVCVISACYSHIIEAFPSGGGGYLVASKLLGGPAGVVSGCALLVDYVLTITVSVAG